MTAKGHFDIFNISLLWKHRHIHHNAWQTEHRSKAHSRSDRLWNQIACQLKMCDIWSRQNRPRASVFLCMTNLWSQYQWFCRIHRNCWRRHSRSIWCSRDGRRVARIGDPLKNRHNGGKTFSLQRIPQFVWILRYFAAGSPQHYWNKWNIYIEFQVHHHLKFNVKQSVKMTK